MDDLIPIAKPQLGEEEREAVEGVLSSGVIAQGHVVAEFESEFSRFCSTDIGVATSSGTTALHLGLLASGVAKGDEVITSPFSFIATANSILYCDARPVFADIDERTFNINPDEIESRITRKTKAVLIVHLYGQPCDMDSITDICEAHDLKLIEDACQAHGATYKGQSVGSLGDCGVFSFYPTKNMTTGEGGMITTNNEEIANKARLLREHGSKKRYHHDILGYNYRMTDIAAAIGNVQLKKLEGFNSQRIKNAERLSETVGELDGLTPPYNISNAKHVYHQYTVRVSNDFHLSRDKVAGKLREQGIDTGIYYPVPIHKQPFYKSKATLREAENAAKEVLSLPVHPSLSGEDLNTISTALMNL